MWKKPRDVLLRHNSQSKRDRGSHTLSAISFEVALLCQVQMSFFRNLVIIYLISTYFLSPRLCSKGSSACRGQFRDSCFFLYKSHIPLDFPLCENVVTLLPSASVLTLSVTHKSHLQASVHSDYLKGILRGWSGGGGGRFQSVSRTYIGVHSPKTFFFPLKEFNSCCTCWWLHQRFWGPGGLRLGTCTRARMNVCRNPVLRAASRGALWRLAVTWLPITLLSSRARQGPKPIRIPIHFLRGNSSGNGAVVGMYTDNLDWMNELDSLSVRVWGCGGWGGGTWNLSSSIEDDGEMRVLVDYE